MRQIILMACLAFCGCGTFRAVVRDLNNANLIGRPAPAVDEGEWVGEEVRLDGDWYLVCFLLPL